MKPKYTLNDLTIRPTHSQTTEDGMTKHTHTVLFDRPLTAKEQQQFTQLILNLPDLSDRSFGSLNVTFISPNQAIYAFEIKSLAGSWKDLLFASLAKFSEEVVGIAQHDGFPVFWPKVTLKNEELEKYSFLKSSVKDI